jgi:hypothetical protein
MQVVLPLNLLLVQKLKYLHFVLLAVLDQETESLRLIKQLLKGLDGEAVETAPKHLNLELGLLVFIVLYQMFVVEH